jgi:hypothetical protein
MKVGDYETHEAADAFPMMSEYERSRFEWESAHG